MPWSISTIKNLVKSDVGISFLPHFSVGNEIGRGGLVEIETDIDNASISAVCAHHKNKWVSPLMQLFIDLSVNRNKQAGEKMTRVEKAKGIII